MKFWVSKNFESIGKRCTEMFFRLVIVSVKPSRTVGSEFIRYQNLNATQKRQPKRSRFYTDITRSLQICSSLTTNLCWCWWPSQPKKNSSDPTHNSRSSILKNSSGYEQTSVTRCICIFGSVGTFGNQECSMTYCDTWWTIRCAL